MVEKIITIKKRGGGTRKQRVRVLPSGKFKFIKNKTTSKRKAPKRRSAPKRKAPKRKTNKQRKAPKRKMATKKSALSKIPIINNPTFKKVALGVGTATLGVSILSLVAPSIANQPLVKPVLAFVGGGIPGIIGQLITQGGIGGLTNLVSGNGGNTNTSNGGFA